MSDSSAVDDLRFEFPTAVRTAPVEPGYMKHYVALPPPIAEALEAAGVRRVIGDIGGHRFERTVQRGHDGQPCLRFGQGWLRRAGLAAGDDIWVELAPDPEPDRVRLPTELEAALADAPDLRPRWNSLSPGKRRTHAMHVDRAKRAETRARRARQIVDDLRAAGD